MAWQESGWAEIWATLAKEPPVKPPLELVRTVFLRSVSQYQSTTMLAVDRLIRSTETLHARKQLAYAEHEQALYEVLRGLWPDENRRVALRLALDTWSQEDGQRPIAEHIETAFDVLSDELKRQGG